MLITQHTLVCLYLLIVIPVYAGSKTNILPILQLLLLDDQVIIVCVGPGANTTVDTDHDGISNCDERSARFGYKTDENLKDTDHDGISDGDEMKITASGLDLRLFGVSPLRKDVLIEFDWMEGEASTNNFIVQRPHDETIAAIIDVFANAPLKNPDGSSGIHLVVDYGQGGDLTGGNLIPDDDGMLEKGFRGEDYSAHKTAHFSQQRRAYFHYLMGVTRNKSNFGIRGGSIIGVSEAYVSMGWAHTEKPALYTRVVLHELGHQFGLRHGGYDDCDYKPNYNSIMNRNLVQNGMDLNCDGQPDGEGLNFSEGNRITLNENYLNERLGMCGAPLDFNKNGAIETGVAFDLNASLMNQELRCGALLTTLRDHNDWEAMKFGISHQY